MQQTFPAQAAPGAGGLEESQAMPNTRGGSRRQPVPLVEVGALQQAFEELVRKMGEKVFDFGVYRSLARAQAANAHGLAANEQAIGTFNRDCFFQSRQDWFNQS